MTATRGCKGAGVLVWPVTSLLVFGPWDGERAGDCGGMVDVEDEIATALSRDGGAVEVDAGRQTSRSGFRDGRVRVEKGGGDALR